MTIAEYRARDITDDSVRPLLSVNTMNALLNAGKRTIEDVLALSEDELARMRKLGVVGRAQVAQLRIAARDAEELARLRGFRDEIERSVRRAPASKAFTADDAKYLRVLASYGGRAVRAQWLYDFACRIDNTLAELEALAYAPGDWICPTCGYVESKRQLNVHAGTISASAEPALPCPNDGQYMERRTYKQTAADLQQISEQLLDRALAAEGKVADLECQPLVLITQRLTYAKALVDAQLCDAAEAERRALRTYPSPPEGNRA